MNASAQFLNPAQAARRLGVSAKALRLYEARGLIAPVRTAAGWRAYGPDEMARVAEIAALRELGLSLAQVARVLDGDLKSLEPALAAHQAALEGRVHQLAGAVDKVRRLRADLAAVLHHLKCVHGQRVSSRGGLEWACWNRFGPMTRRFG